MQLDFSKYQGAGNDFVVIDNRDNTFPKKIDVIKKLCDRHLGIGADGLMLLESSKEADFYMRYYNSDGNESTMCGNGGRCITHFAKKIGLIESSTHFIGIDGEHFANIEDSNLINLKMQDVDGVEVGDNYYFLNTGSPHYVCFVNDVQQVEVDKEGRKIRNSFNLKNGGTNVNFVDLLQDSINVRTFERGVEAETLACGTGSVASAIVYSIYTKKILQEYTIRTQGGSLTIRFEKVSENEYKNIWLKGPATLVFNGVIDI